MRPVAADVVGEPEPIFRSWALAPRQCGRPFDNVKAVVHGHAHRGAYRVKPRWHAGLQLRAFVVRPEFGRPYALLEV
jgi:hypothetical protein